MADSSKKMEPWQLILILILVLAFFGGLYIVNQTITSQLESIEGALDAKTEMLKSGLDNINRRLDNMKTLQAMAQPAAAPAPTPEAGGTADGADDGTGPADDGSSAPAPEKKE